MHQEIRADLSKIGNLITDPAIYQRDEWEPFFAALRRDDPVHYTSESGFGPNWAITRFNDIKEIEANHQVFSSDWRLGGCSPIDELVSQSFFMMDPPEHTEQREVLSALVLPEFVKSFEDLIRRTTRRVLDDLPESEAFDWVDRVSIEITSTMLAALMDYPMDQRRELVRWSEISTAFPDDPNSPISSEQERREERLKFTERMMTIWKEKAKLPPENNLISLLAHSELMTAMPLEQRMGTLATFLVGGNDTTRNTMSGGLWALWQHPDELKKVRENLSLIPAFVQECLRWQTPSMLMRRTALEDVEFRGRKIRKGDKIILWYISANRDEEAIERASEFIVDRKRPRQHLSFGFGIHRCIGSRIAELQLRILWEEFFARDIRFEVLEKPEYAYSSAFRSIRRMPVCITKGARGN